jgi:hypothetical protein
MNVGVVGVFIAPTTKLDRWWRLSVRWRTGQSGAHRTCPVPLPHHHCRWILTVGASDLWALLDVRCTPDMYCSMSGAPVWARLPSARAAHALNASQVAVGTEIAVAPLLHRTVRCTPDMLKGKCAFGPFLSILVIECKHKCLNVKICPRMNKVQITS